MPGEGIPGGWALAAAFDRWALYTFMLLAAGSALFMLVVKPPAVIAAAAERLGRISAMAAAAAYMLAVGIGGADMVMGGPGALFSGATWRMGGDTTLAASAVLGVSGMALLAFGFSVKTRISVAALPSGVALAVLSFLVTGHAATAEPVWLMAPMIAVHLLCAAFWLGALWPLHVAARELPVVEAGALMMQFSVRALFAVTALLASGAVIACVQLGGLTAFISTGYGFVLIIKLLLVAGLLVLADHNRGVITPKMLAGDATAPARMRRSISAEYVLYVLIVAAAAGLAVAIPPRSL